MPRSYYVSGRLTIRTAARAQSSHDDEVSLGASARLAREPRHLGPAVSATGPLGRSGLGAMPDLGRHGGGGKLPVMDRGSTAHLPVVSAGGLIVIGLSDWAVVSAGGLIVIGSFVAEGRAVVEGRVPESYPAWLFRVGFLLALAWFGLAERHGRCDPESGPMVFRSRMAMLPGGRRGNTSTLRDLEPVSQPRRGWPRAGPPHSRRRRHARGTCSWRRARMGLSAVRTRLEVMKSVPYRRQQRRTRTCSSSSNRSGPAATGTSAT